MSWLTGVTYIIFLKFDLESVRTSSPLTSMYRALPHFDNLVDEVARSMASQAASRICHLPAERSESTRMFPGSADVRNAYGTAHVVRAQFLRGPTSAGAPCGDSTVKSSFPQAARQPSQRSSVGSINNYLTNKSLFLGTNLRKPRISVLIPRRV